MKIWLVRILILILFILFIIFYYNIADFTPKEDILLEKITKLESKIDSINNKKDSIRTVIITVDKEIIKNTERHEKVVNNIINNSDSINRIWTNDYIKRYIDRIRNN